MILAILLLFFEMITYDAFNRSVFDKIPSNKNHILDVGCGTGELGKALKLRSASVHVVGLTYSKEEALMAKNNIDEVLISDINKALPIFQKPFDCMIFSHILEHTCFPVEVLKSFANFLDENGIIVVALPNVLFYKQRWQFLAGNFKYSKVGGLMDETHFHFFDFETAQSLFVEAGFEIISKDVTGNFPLGPLRSLFPRFSKVVDRVSLSVLPGLFGVQFILTGKRQV